MKTILSKLTLWRLIGAGAIAFGLYATIIRFAFGLGASTNLSDEFPWGLWVGFDVLVGVGLAAGGFTITAAVYIFNIERLRPIVRPTILTAFLGYLLVCAGLGYDLGRPYRLWHPLIMWNPHSVMFEVAWCVMFYLTVLGLEFSPMLLERLRLHKLLKIVKTLSVPIVIAGVLLSTLHQSSLGTLYIIVPDKLHGLWYSPLLPVFFFVSAIAAGLSMVILESFISSRAFNRRLEFGILQDLSRAIVVVLAIFLVLKLQDMAGRGAWSLLAVPGPERFLFLCEMGFGVTIPLLLLAFPSVRATRQGLFCCALLVVLGFVLGRLNVAITGMQRGMGANYFPSALEIGVTAMLVACGVVAFALAVKYLQVFPEAEEDGADEPPQGSGSPVAALLPQVAVGLLGAVMVAGVFVVDFSDFSRPQSDAGDGETIEASPVVPDELTLPEDFDFPKGENSPGLVTFSHELHVDPDQPDCANCHAAAFPILKVAEDQRPKLAEKAMHQKARCGRCHNGKPMFSVDEEDDCEMCHLEEVALSK